MINCDVLKAVRDAGLCVSFACRTESQAIAACNILHALGYRWINRERLDKATHFDYYGGHNGVRYCLHKNRDVTISGIDDVPDGFYNINVVLPDEDDGIEYNVGPYGKWLACFTPA